MCAGMHWVYSGANWSMALIKSPRLTSCAVLLNWHGKGLSGRQPNDIGLRMCSWLSQTLVCIRIFSSRWHHMQSQPCKYSHGGNVTSVSSTGEIALWVHPSVCRFSFASSRRKRVGRKWYILEEGESSERSLLFSSLHVVFGWLGLPRRPGFDPKLTDIHRSLSTHFRASWILWWVLPAWDERSAQAVGLYTENPPSTRLETLLSAPFFISLFIEPKNLITEGFTRQMVVL